MSFQAYKIAIGIEITGKVSSVLGLMARDFAKTDAQAVRLKKTLNEIKLLGAAGLGFSAAGAAMLYALKGPYEAAKNYEAMLARFRSLNLGDSVNRDADKFARAAGIYGVSATDLIGTIRDLHTVIGNYEHAKSLAPLIAQMEFANLAVFGEKGARFDDAQRKALARVIEIRGGFKSEAEMRTQADLMQHVITGTGGMVLPSEYLQFLKTGGVAAQKLTNRAFYYGFEPLIQELGGFRTGTGLQTAFNRLILGIGGGGASGKAMWELLSNIGIAQPGGIEVNKTTGRITKIAGHLKEGDVSAFESDPEGWVLNRLVPALQKAGYGTDDKILNALALIFGRTGGAVFSKAYLQREKIAKNIAIDERAMGISELIAASRNTPGGSELALKKAWENLGIAAGRSIVPVVIKYMNDLADALNRLGLWMEAHPRLTENLVDGFIGLAGSLLFAGSVLSLTAAFKSLKLLFTVGGLVPAIWKAAAGAGAAGGAGGASTVAPGVAGAAAGAGGAAVVAGGALAVATGLMTYQASKQLQKSSGGEMVGVDIMGGGMPIYAAPGNGTTTGAASASQGPSLVDQLVTAIKQAFAGVAVNLDGQKVGQMVGDKIANGSGNPSSGPSHFDLSASYSTP